MMQAELTTDPLNDLPEARAFVAAASPLSDAYRHGLFTFVALLHHGEKVILRAQLRLAVDGPVLLKPPISATRLFAGQVALTVDFAAVKACLRSAMTAD